MGNKRQPETLLFLVQVEVQETEEQVSRSTL